jgi:phosphoglucosamine mutase
MRVFGTDGIRGTVNTHPITPAFFVKLGNALGYYLKLKHLNQNQKPKVLIGKDTRLSGYMIESSLMSGLVSAGVDVILTGPLPTPAISILTLGMRAEAGIMITASHNQFYDNGVKIFDDKGAKISKQTQQQIEDLLDTQDTSKFLVASPEFGRAKRIEDASGRYVEFVKNTFPKNLSLKGLKIALDCANGAAYKLAPDIFWELGAEVYTFNNNPNGLNINLECGSTYPGFVSSKVKETGADIGISLDGDADRIIICDEKGQIMDGNHIIGVIANYLYSKGNLKSSKVVSTIIANMGLELYLNSLGISLERTPVGDSFVGAAMNDAGCNLGGEPSGHILLSDYCKTGDAIIASLQLLAVMLDSGVKASELCKIFEKTPSVEQNIKLGTKQIDQSAIDSSIKKVKADYPEAKLNIVVRKSRH